MANPVMNPKKQTRKPVQKIAPAMETQTPVVEPKHNPAKVEPVVPVKTVEKQPFTFNPAMPFGRQNYLFMLAGVALLIIGFTVMSLDKEEFGFGILGLTVGPVIIMAGFITEFFAILRKPKVV
jgi:hypothetical protein